KYIYHSLFRIGCVGGKFRKGSWIQAIGKPRINQADLKKDATPMDDSDLEKKRRETDALLQSMGITSADVPVAQLVEHGA
ncbi:hypothetical protein J4Q44_G00201270, partial [Coregonus suidteri]